MKVSLTTPTSLYPFAVQFRLVLLLLVCSLMGTHELTAQTQIFFEDFATNNTFGLNSTGPGGNLAQTGQNQWIVNDDYNGAGVYQNTTSQNSTVSGSINNPNGNYLHVYNAPGGPTNANYDPANASENWVVMNGSICTQGLQNIEMGFFWTAGGNADAYAEIYYSVDNGTTWNLTTNNQGITQYFNQDDWRFNTITNPDFDNQNNLRFAIRWVNDASPSSQLDTISSFGIDDIYVTAEDDTTTAFGLTVTPSSSVVCQGTPLEITIEHDSSLCTGNYQVELSPIGGNFGAGAPTLLEFTNATGTQTFGTTTTISSFATTIPITEYVLIPAFANPAPCYRIRVIRVGNPPPADTSNITACIEIQDCPNTITTNEPVVLSNPNDTICVNSVIDVPFNSTGVFTVGNTYFAQLSDSSGSFEDSVNIGFLTTTSSFPDPMQPGSISGTIPDVPDGCNYYLRVWSSNPQVPNSSIVTYGPFCIKHCDIETNDMTDILACVSDSVGFDTTLTYQTNSWDSTVTYGTDNVFSVQLMDSQNFSEASWNDLGWVQADTTGTLQLSIPPGDSLGDFGIAPGLYYMRITASNSSNPNDTLGTLVRLNIGYPVGELTLSVIGDTVICTNTGNAIDFIASPGNPNSPPISDYVWTVNGNPTVLASRFVTLNTGNSPGTINVTAQEIHNGCPGPVSDERVVTIISEPDLSTINTQYAACTGDQVTYTVPFNDFTNYSWNIPPEVDTLDISNNEVTVDWDSAGTYVLEVEAINKCVNSNTVDNENTLTIEVFDVPEVLMPNDTTICLDDSLVLDPVVTPSGESYIWFRESTNVGVTDSTLTHNADTPNDTTLYYLIYGNQQAGCFDSDTTIVYNGGEAQINTPDTTICPGDTALLLATGADQYLWGPAAALDTTAGAAVNGIPDSVTLYTVQMTQNLPQGGQCILTDSVQVSLPTPPSAPADTQACRRATLTLQASGGSSYLWGPDSVLSNITGEQVEVTPQTATELTLQTTQNLFGGGSCLYFDTLQVAIQLPDTLDSVAVELCPEDGPVQLSPSESGLLYEWTTGADAQSISTSTLDTVAVYVVQDSTCFYQPVYTTDQDCPEEPEEPEELPVFNVPNVFTPNGDNVNDLFRPDIQNMAVAKIFIYNRWGGLVFSTDDAATVFWDGTDESGDESPEGVYFYVIKTEHTDGTTFESAGQVTLLR